MPPKKQSSRLDSPQESGMQESPESIVMDEIAPAPTTPSATNNTIAPSLHVVDLNNVWRPSSPTEKPTFSGQLMEDPVNFLRRVCEYFSQTAIDQDHMKLYLIRSMLTDKAAIWWKPYDGLLINWAEFEERFLDDFNGEEVQQQLEAALFDNRQKRGQTAEVYLLQKRQIWARLLPEAHISEEAAVFASVRGLTDIYAGRMYAEAYKTFPDAVKKARAVEKTLPRTEPSSVPTSRPIIKSAPHIVRSESKPREPPIPRCWYCPGRHYNKDCPTQRPATASRAFLPRASETEAATLEQLVPANRCSPPAVSAMTAAPVQPYFETQSHDRIPRIEITINDQCILAAIDTASTTNFIRADLVEPELRRPSEYSSVNLACRNHQLPVIECADLSWIASDAGGNSTFHLIDDLDNDVILGTQWLREHDAVIDYTRQTLQVGATTLGWSQTPTAPVTDTLPPVDPLATCISSASPRCLDLHQRDYQPFRRLPRECSELHRRVNDVPNERSSSRSKHMEKIATRRPALSRTEFQLPFEFCDRDDPTLCLQKDGRPRDASVLYQDSSGHPRATDDESSQPRAIHGDAFTSWTSAQPRG